MYISFLLADILKNIDHEWDQSGGNNPNVYNAFEYTFQNLCFCCPSSEENICNYTFARRSELLTLWSASPVKLETFRMLQHGA